MPEAIPPIGPYRFFFYSQDCSEKPHVHVKRDTHKAKFWLTPVSVAKTGGFQPHELAEIEKLVKDQRNKLMARWRKFCKGAQ